ncbi:MAG: ParB/RepB/Spo0J family partition protein [Alphaproteobacteria bacterium]|nr:ParB/RepB/Spo0J family partition protein [Alphaproteobacteria bacterium]
MTAAPPKPIAKPSPLGRGLSALFGDADASYQPPVATPRASSAAPAAEAVKGETLRKMPVTWLKSGIYQPRRRFDEAALQELAASIRERGILEPLLVRAAPGGPNAYEIIAGERRWRAAQIAGLHEVPVMVRELTDREALEFGIIENVQREDLSPLEEAEGYKRLLEEFGHTQEALAKIVGKSRPHITNMLRLLTLPPEIRQMLGEGSLSMAHARAIVPVKDPLPLAREIVKKGLNVRQAEALAKRHQDNPEIHKKRAGAMQADADARGLEKELERVIGLKVKIAPKGKGGTLTLIYHDLDQLDDIIRKLRS